VVGCAVVAGGKGKRGKAAESISVCDLPDVERREKSGALTNPSPNPFPLGRGEEGDVRGETGREGNQRTPGTGGLRRSALMGPSNRVLWIVLAMIPSSLTLGVTQHITTDVAAVPLLWVVPLGVYLLTYVVAFSRFGARAVRWGRWGLAVLSVCAAV